MYEHRAKRISERIKQEMDFPDGEQGADAGDGEQGADVIGSDNEGASNAGVQCLPP